MANELYNHILQDIKARTAWGERQAVWYQMRRDGIRRKNKPFPNAADMHFPLVDMIIDKFKPFYRNQLFATERLADFVSNDPQAAEVMTDVAWWFDYKLKQKSNIERQIMHCIDWMLQDGRGIIKTTWDVDGKCLRFNAIEPLYLVVPADTEELQQADRITHVQHYSEWKYKNSPETSEWRKDDVFVQRIKGAKDPRDVNRLDQLKIVREGLTYTANQDLIIVWESYERTTEGWRVSTFSPIAPEEPIRADYILPYKMEDKEFAPFVDFTFEITDKGWYAPRGVTEILSQYEVSLCKLWNEKHDALTFYNRPIFSAGRDVPNAGNIKMRPGDILPFEIKAIERGSPPMSWDSEMISTRNVAEQRIAVPDFGIGKQEDAGGGKRTATEIDALTSYTSSVVDMRSSSFRSSLGQLYAQAWALLVQYDKDFSFLRESAKAEVDPEALKKVLTIKPNGSSDSWNQHRRLQKAVSRRALFGNSPYINKAELDKSILELDEPGLVARLFIDPGIQQQEQASLQMMEIPALEDGLPVTPSESDDDAVHATLLIQYFAQSMKQQKPVSPQGQQALQQHLAAHMQRLAQKDPKAAKAIQQQAVQMAQASQQQGGIPQ